MADRYVFSLDSRASWRMTTETRLRGRLLAEYVDDESAKKFLKDTVSAFSQA